MQVLLRCRREPADGCASLSKASERSQIPELQLCFWPEISSDHRTSFLFLRRPPTGDEIKQRVQQVVKVEEAAKEARKWRKSPACAAKSASMS